MKKNNFWLLIFALTIMKQFAYSQSANKVKNYVPNDSTAIKIAEAVWYPTYGKSVDSSRPFKAFLQGDTLWIVTGTAPMSNKEIVGGDTIFHFIHRGVPYIEISKSDGKILKVSHSK